MIINQMQIRKRAKEHGRRVSMSYLMALNSLLERKIEESCRVHNGGKITLDDSVVSHVFGG
jgi:hypothetical protein